MCIEHTRPPACVYILVSCSLLLQARRQGGIPVPQDLEEQMQATTSSHHARKKGRQWLKMLKKRQSNVVMDEMELPTPTLHHDDNMNKIVIDGAAACE